MSSDDFYCAARNEIVSQPVSKYLEDTTREV